MAMRRTPSNAGMPGSRPMPKPQGQPGRPTNEEAAGQPPVPTRLPITQLPSSHIAGLAAKSPEPRPQEFPGTLQESEGESPEALLEMLHVLMQMGMIDGEA